MSQKTTYTPQQRTELKAIKKDGQTNALLHAFAVKNGMTYENVYAAWWYMLNRTKIRARVKRNAKKAPIIAAAGALVEMNKRRYTKRIGAMQPVKASKKPVAYQLEIGADVKARGDQQARIDMFMKMKPTILSMGVRQHTLPIYNADVVAMRKVLEDSSFQAMVFGFTKIPGNPKMRRMYRKA